MKYLSESEKEKKEKFWEKFMPLMPILTLSIVLILLLIIDSGISSISNKKYEMKKQQREMLEGTIVRMEYTPETRKQKIDIYTHTVYLSGINQSVGSGSGDIYYRVTPDIYKITYTNIGEETSKNNVAYVTKEKYESYNIGDTFIYNEDDGDSRNKPKSYNEY